MSYWTTLLCSLFAYLPALVFWQLWVAPDPLRIIVCITSAFVWLLSAIPPSAIAGLLDLFVGYSEQGSALLLTTLFVSVAFQEAFRALFYAGLHKMERGIAQFGAQTGESAKTNDEDGRQPTVRITGSLMDEPRLLAIVAGLGQGTVASLLLFANTFAATARLPGGEDGNVLAARLLDPNRTIVDEWTPLRVQLATTPGMAFYCAASAALLVLHHMVWTSLQWESCRRKVTPATSTITTSDHTTTAATTTTVQFTGAAALPSRCRSSAWWIGAVLAFAAHLVNSALSALNKSGHQPLVLVSQLILLVTTALLAFYICGATLDTVRNAIATAWQEMGTRSKSLQDGPPQPRSFASANANEGQRPSQQHLSNNHAAAHV